jgi:pyroglutamyl-peptidase
MAPTSGPIRILVTGFGSFPGARKNPTEALVRALGKDKARLARLGIKLEVEILPVVYAEILSRLEALTQTYRPDAILHLGLAARRKVFSIETRAVNRLSRLRPDASGAVAARLQIRPGAPQHARSTFPAVEVVTALRRAGVASRLSSNAGRYICNQALYLSLARGDAPQVGFIHVPRLARRSPRGRSEGGRGPTQDDLTRAAIIAVQLMARKLRRGRVDALASPRSEPVLGMT